MEGEKTADVEKGHEIVDWDLQVRLESVLLLTGLHILKLEQLLSHMMIQLFLLKLLEFI